MHKLVNTFIPLYNYQNIFTCNCLAQIQTIYFCKFYVYFIPYFKNDKSEVRSIFFEPVHIHPTLISFVANEFSSI